MTGPVPDSPAADLPAADASGEVAALFQVIKGQPDAAELAALTAVVLALVSDANPDVEDEADSATHGRSWARRNRLRLAPLPGPGAWRRSAWR